MTGSLLSMSLGGCTGSCGDQTGGARCVALRRDYRVQKDRSVRGDAWAMRLGGPSGPTVTCWRLAGGSRCVVVVSCLSLSLYVCLLLLLACRS